MGSIIFIGDELTATGLRLAGVEVLIPRPGEAATVLAEARRRAAVVLISSALATLVPERVLHEALVAADPLVAIVPEVSGRVGAPDIASRIKATLGIGVAS